MSVIAGEGATTPYAPTAADAGPEPDLFTVDLRLRRLEAAAGLGKADSSLSEENNTLRAEVAELTEERDRLRSLLDAEREMSAALVKVARDFHQRIGETITGGREL